jgi:hypothetical protein
MEGEKNIKKEQKKEREGNEKRKYNLGTSNRETDRKKGKKQRKRIALRKKKETLSE